jgi:hypothetical protein
MNKSSRVLSLLLIMFGAAQLDGQVSQVNVTTWHNDKGRTGQNTSEQFLNTSSFAGRNGGLAHAFTPHKNGCPVLLAFFARGRGFSLTSRPVP